MNLIKNYREQTGKTQKELCEELKDVCPGVDVSLVCKMEKGICLPTDEVMAYVKKALAIPKTGDKSDEQGNMPLRENDLPNGRFFGKVYEELQRHSILKPALRSDLMRVTGLPDREVRSVVKDMRRAGIPVCSSSGRSGYWLGSPSDIKAMSDEYRARAMDMLATAKALNTYDPNQIRMDI